MIIRFLRAISLAWLAPATAMANDATADATAPALAAADRVCALATAAALEGPLTTAGLIDENKVDHHRTEISLLAKEALSDGQGTRQVFLLTLHEAGPSGRAMRLVETSEAREGECPATDAVAYIVSREVR